jgi:hypothetical protein
MLHVGFGGLDEVRDEVVAAFQLNIDLREGIFEAVAQRHELVVLAYDEKQEKSRYHRQNNQQYHKCSHARHFAAVAGASQ